MHFSPSRGSLLTYVYHSIAIFHTSKIKKAKKIEDPCPLFFLFKFNYNYFFNFGTLRTHPG